MARQLSEQLEREVNAEELLKLQNKPVNESPKAGTPAAIDTTPTPATAPAVGVTPAGNHSPISANSPAVAPGTTAPANAAPPSPSPITPDPVYGLAASATTAAAMHASDPPVVDNKPPNE